MKKFFVIIGVLLVIFISMVIYRKQEMQNRNITVGEVQKIQEYISRIYMWKEVTGEALPKFEDINQAPETWIWEVVKNNLEIYELTKEEIEQKAKEIFGEEFSKEFPQEGNSAFTYNPETQKYIATEINIDNKEDSFFVNKIEKDKKIYTVEIIEYLEDYSETESTDQTSATSIYLENENEEKIVTIPSTTAEPDILENLKQNADKFPKKTLIIQEDEEGNLKVQKVIE